MDGNKLVELPDEKKEEARIEMMRRGSIAWAEEVLDAVADQLEGEYRPEDRQAWIDAIAESIFEKLEEPIEALRADRQTWQRVLEALDISPQLAVEATQMIKANASDHARNLLLAHVHGPEQVREKVVTDIIEKSHDRQSSIFVARSILDALNKHDMAGGTQMVAFTRAEFEHHIAQAHADGFSDPHGVDKPGSSEKESGSEHYASGYSTFVYE